MAHEQLKSWNPGFAPYAEWLKTLTPEQYAAHLEERKKKKALKQVVKETQEQYRAEWAAALHNAAVSVLEKAVASGDANAFATVYDRLVGKPDSTTTVTVNSKDSEYKGYTIELHTPSNNDDNNAN